jgi:hypothetical protein
MVLSPGDGARQIKRTMTMTNEIRQLTMIELTDEELNTAVGAWDPGGQEYGARWAAARAAPTPAEWKAIGEQLSATYIANHSPHLGQPRK